MPRSYAKADLRPVENANIKDPEVSKALKAVAKALREVDRFLQTTGLGNFGDFETKDDSSGIVCLAGGRRYRLRVTVSGETKGGGELQINSAGAATAARNSSAKGTIIIKVEDLGA